MVYRTFSQLIRDILYTAKDGKTKTSIMGSANLNNEQYKHYLPALEEVGYLERVDSKLRTTGKGFEAMKILRESALIEENIKRHIKKK